MTVKPKERSEGLRSYAAIEKFAAPAEQRCIYTDNEIAAALRCVCDYEPHYASVLAAEIRLLARSLLRLEERNDELSAQLKNRVTKRRANRGGR